MSRSEQKLGAVSAKTERLTRDKKGPLRAFLNQVLSAEQIEVAKKVFATLAPTSNLELLAYLYNTDKWGYHNYIHYYDRHFRPLRTAKINLLEIGVGGYEFPNDPSVGGESLRLWKKFFPNAKIYGIDILDKSGVDESRIKTFKGSQDDPQFLEHVVQQIGNLDIVIDDGSHRSEHVTQTFNVLFPRLAPKGLYVIEDLQTSYWSTFGGNSTDLNDSKTTMSMLKSLADGLNFQEFILKDYQPTFSDLHVVGMHFYHNIAFVEKGLNNDSPGTKCRPSLEEERQLD